MPLLPLKAAQHSLKVFNQLLWRRNKHLGFRNQSCHTSVVILHQGICLEFNREVRNIENVSPKKTAPMPLWPTCQWPVCPCSMVQCSSSLHRPTPQTSTRASATITTPGHSHQCQTPLSPLKFSITRARGGSCCNPEPRDDKRNRQESKVQQGREFKKHQRSKLHSKYPCKIHA